MMEILNSEEHEDIVSWLPHGKAFMIHKKKRFAEEVLPQYFKAAKFTSFTRKLNRWGFTRVTRGTEMGSYFHKFFQRSDPRMCMQMSSNSSSKASAHQQMQMGYGQGYGMSPAAMFGMPFGMPGMFPPPPEGATPEEAAQHQQMIFNQMRWQQQMFAMQQAQQQSSTGEGGDEQNPTSEGQNANSADI